jgi:hypothetical protein
MRMKKAPARPAPNAGVDADADAAVVEAAK